MRKITLFMSFFVISFATYAVGLIGTYKVGTSETTPNYASLSAAVADINLNGVSGDVLLEITSDLTEAANISLGVNMSAFKLTIKPASGLNPIINFTDGTTSANIDGHFVIGSPNALNTNLIPTNNIIIDGSNTINGITKNLTINGPATTAQRSVFRIYGNNDNITIKNCTIVNYSSSGSSTAPINVTDYTTLATDNLVILNNTLVSNSGNGGVGVQVSVSGTPTALMNGIKVQNNIITARATRAIFFNYVADGEISGNTISHDCQIVASAAASIAVMTGGTGVAGTFNIFNNRINKAKTWNTTNAATSSVGIIAIDNQLSTPKIVNIYNNFISGFEINSSSVNSVKIYGIRHTSSSTSNIYHNTIVFPDLTDMSVMTNSFLTGICFATAATTEVAPTGTAVIKNNIIISNESTMKVWAIRRVGTGGTLTSNNNIIYAATSNNLIGFYNATDASDLLSWQNVSGQDADSKITNVNFENTSAGDFRITGSSVQDINLKVPFLDAVTTDILGKVRNTAFTYAGAHESTLPFLSTQINYGVTAKINILRTTSGIEVQLDRETNVELFTLNGVMIDKARVSGTYSRALNSGVYIIRIDGKATKFVK